MVEQSYAMTLDQIRARCATDSGCWIWQGALIRGVPYVSVHEDGTRYNRRVQKVVLALVGTPVPVHVRIRQTCGNGLCCHPGHQVPKDHAAFLHSLAGNPWAGLFWKQVLHAS